MAWPWTVDQVIATAFAFIGVFLVGRGVLRLVLRNPEQGWRKVPGQIVTSEIDFSNEIYRAKIRYCYEFDGITQEGSGIAPIEGWSSFRSTAAHFVNKYPVGQRVSVYVNPSNPSSAVLEPQQQPIAAITEMLLGLTAGMCGLLWWLTSGP